MKHIKTVLLSAAMLIGLVGSFGVMAQPVSAINLFEDCRGEEVCNEATDPDASSDLVKSVINLLLYIIGVVAVIVIIISGIKYVTSGGDSNAVASAKNTLLYAVVGLVIAMLAFAIVNFVVGAFK